MTGSQTMDARPACPVPSAHCVLHAVMDRKVLARGFAYCETVLLRGSAGECSCA